MAHEPSCIRVPVLLGPTAAGKTAVALEIAEKKRWEIISCDSRQLYRFMDIGTAKPRKEELNRVRHWLIDSIDPSDRYSAAAFIKDAGDAIRSRAGKGVTTLLCGGTGFYFESLRKGIGPQVASDPEMREMFMRRAEEEGSAALHHELYTNDPEAAGSINVNDVQRIVRALTVYYQTGEKFSELKKHAVPPDDIDFTVAVLLPPRPLLYDRINRRTEEMFRQGLWEEFKALRGRGYDERTPGLQCVGYQELFAVEKGTCTLKEALEKIQRNSRRYAKRQVSWFTQHNGDSIIEYDENMELCIKRISGVFMS